MLFYIVDIGVRSLITSPHAMPKTTPARFANPELAKRIASINGGEVMTLKVKMVGKKDVAQYLKEVKQARAVKPAGKLRVK